MISKQAVLDVLKNNLVDPKLLLEIDAIPSISDGWISVETPPKDDRTVLVFTSHGCIGTAQYDNLDWIITGIGYADNVTHWQPLPQKPTA